MCRMGSILPSFQKLDRYRLKIYNVKAINPVIERDLPDVLKGNIVNIMPGQHSDIHYKNVDKELLTIMEDAREIPQTEQTEQTEQAEQVSSPEAARIAELESQLAQARQEASDNWYKYVRERAEMGYARDETPFEYRPSSDFAPPPVEQELSTYRYPHEKFWRK